MSGLQDDAAGEPDARGDYAILAGSPTPAELAAIVAVIEAQARERQADALQPAPAHRSAWDRSRAALRAPLAPGSGAWRGFGG